MTRLASLFTDHMVLQSGRVNPIWGWDRPGQAVTLRIEGTRSPTGVVTTVTGADGAFRIPCPELPVGGPYRLHVLGSRECTLDDVLSGEVWLASGQSNMEWKLSMSAHGDVEAERARWPQIHMFAVARRAAREPQTRVDGGWRPCSPEAAGDFSAVGYYFAREIHRRLSVPVGIIEASWGGTLVEAWTSIEALRSVMDVDAEPARSEENEPGGLYHGMIAPLVPFGLRGVIWYQGESNVDNHSTYRDRFVALIRDWRAKWSRTGEIAFYFVQLAGFVESPAWPYLREAQAEALAEPATGMAVTIDIGDPDDIHPRNKQDVGRRLALVALARSYGQSDEWSGPRFDRVDIGVGRVRVAFRHAAGLRARGGGEVRGFVLAGDDRVWRAARARIDGEAVIVTSPAVEVPVSVRYAWADNPDANLENAAGLPAAPFRTDRW